MGTNSKIEWTDHTLNIWRGCTKVSAGCAGCYAETLSHRNPSVLGIWGPNGTRVVASEDTWREPLKWDRAARKAGERHRVFCLSLGDVFEAWDGPMVDSSGRVLHYNSAATWWVPEPTPHGPITMDFVRERVFSVITSTLNLDYLLVTKRPENALDMMVKAGLYATANPGLPFPQPNVWIGVSVEDRKHGLPRIEAIRQIPAVVRFLSVEPLLEDLGTIDLTGIDWVIVGGESGPGARPMHPDWVRSIRDQCVAAGIPYFHKQNGEWADFDNPYEVCDDPRYKRKTMQQVFVDGKAMNRIGKKAAGRLLDGRTWDELPTAAGVAP